MPLLKANLIQPGRFSTQRGSALMLALFVLTVLLMLGAALMRTLSSSSETIAQEVLGTRALAAANSGMQAHLVQLFPHNLAQDSCPADATYNFDGISGLDHCSAVVTCSLLFPDTSNTNRKGFDVAYFSLTSTGNCGTAAINEMQADSKNIVLSSRTIQVEARTP
ncbi:MSHA biogenesis protein MshP [Thalassomonas haliotis]|uniref:Pilus assembly PilX N-terminal domain-containing protein n=1 Tax=Thalassomonas haliotis TaxID=485448 RepID=A0ABY7VD91_9GAMM|nr:MSHA biogenesis protein MshP [Thalassomonas haliotis]WDE10945.1 pilus assembly PilX N-terminal domain-containing protein [Thalassomonas haliotis]